MRTSGEDTMLTIVMATRNRATYLSRLLHYFAGLQVRHTILIGDGSDPDQLEMAQAVIARLSGALHIAYHVYPHHHDDRPGMGTIVCMSDLLRRVETPYAVFVADDDFVVPPALDAAVRFLDRHPDYSMGHGDAAVFTTAGEAHGEFLTIGCYAQRSIAEPTGAARLVSHFGQLTGTEFSVKRTRQMAVAWQAVCSLELDNYFGELLVSAIGVIHGKTKKLNRLYLVRQSAQQMTSVRSPDLFDWVTGATWPLQYQRMCDHLTAALASQDGITKKQAGAMVQEAMWSYLAPVLHKKWQARYAPKNPVVLPWWRRAAHGVPGLRNAWRRARCMVPYRLDGISLPALLHPSSLYHADFMPIYQAITQHGGARAQGVESGGASSIPGISPSLMEHLSTDGHE